MVASAVLIVQMSDLHISQPGSLVAGRVDTAALLSQAVAHVNALAPAPDLVVVTGDLVDSGGEREYAQLRALLADVEAPVHLLPGNHDDRSAMRAAFPELPSSGRLQAELDVGSLRLLLLDDMIAGSPCGRVGTEQLAWLDGALAKGPDRPTIVALHHPPFLTGIAHMDDMGLEEADALGAVIERHPQVACVVAGHLHRPIVTRWRGALALTAPSVAPQVALDLVPAASARYRLEPPAVLVHRWSPDGGLVTHVSYTGHFAGPYAFDGH